MKRLSLAFLLLVCGAIQAESASAFNGFGAPFMPFGFYQPYGVQYSTSIPTPPYFSLNPPVYYGTRYARPYGISPFAAFPTASAPAGYEGREAARNYLPPAPVSTCNPYVCGADGRSADDATRVVTVGEIRQNPFVNVDPTPRVASLD